MDAFITVVGERGLESLTLDEVASRAGVQRPAVRHFVGNRAALIEAALSELTRRYRSAVEDLCGEQPALDALLDALFGPQWTLGLGVENQAFDALCRQSFDDQGLRERLRETYDVLLDELSRAVARAHPTAESSAVDDVAYVIGCLAEHNVVMQQLGSPEARSRAARRAAAAAARDLGETPRRGREADRQTARSSTQAPMTSTQK